MGNMQRGGKQGPGLVIGQYNPDRGNSPNKNEGPTIEIVN